MSVEICQARLAVAHLSQMKAIMLQHKYFLDLAAVDRVEKPQPHGAAEKNWHAPLAAFALG